MRHKVSEQVEKLRAERGNSVPIERIGEIVDGILTRLDGEATGPGLKLYRDVEALAAYIDATKAEIASIRPQDIRDDHIQAASDQLDAIVGDTEKAAGAILDAAEEIEAVAGRVDPKAAEEIRTAVTSIFEACNFQDITGQRITRVVRALKDIERKVAAIVTAYALQSGAKTAKPARKKKASVAKGKPKDQELLDGPQLPDAAKSQDDIDTLFSSLK